MERWAADGSLPAVAAMARTGATVRLANPMETLPGAIWPELTMGQSAGRVAQYYHPKQLRTGETTTRPVGREEIDPTSYYWSVASRSGRKVCVVDQPQTVLAPGLDGIQVIEWGNHDRNFDAASEPSDLLSDLYREKYGDHPVGSCDSYPATFEGRDRLLTDLIEGVERTGALLLDLLGRDDWDLFVGTITECHCVGHQFWSLCDEDGPGFTPSAPPRLRGAILEVYRRIDRVVGELLDASGPDATVLLVASHGMGPFNGGPSLVQELVLKMGLIGGARARQALPPTVRAWLRRHAPRPPTRCLMPPGSGPARRAP